MTCKTCGSCDLEGSECAKCKEMREKHPEIVEWVLRVIEHQMDKREEENARRESWYRSMDGS